MPTPSHGETEWDGVKHRRGAGVETMELSFNAMAAMVLFPLLWLALVLVYGYRRNKSWKAPKKC